MGGTVQLEVTLVSDRDLLLQALEKDGLEATATDEDGRFGIEVPCQETGHRTCAELLPYVESLVRDAGVPFSAIKASGSIFLRPPGS